MLAYWSFVLNESFDNTIDEVIENGDEFYYYFNGTLSNISHSTLVDFLRDL